MLIEKIFVNFANKILVNFEKKSINYVIKTSPINTFNIIKYYLLLKCFLFGDNLNTLYKKRKLKVREFGLSHYIKTFKKINNLLVKNIILAKHML